jgi:hypothetical protein
MRCRYLAFALSLATLPACSDSGTEFWLPRNDLMPMVALGNRVAYVEKNSATAFVLDPADPSLIPTLHAVGKRPVLAVKHVGSNRLLVVSAGDRGSANKQPVPAQLTVVDPAAIDALPTYYPLASRFDGVAQSEEGRFAVLYHTSSTQDPNDGVLFNPNDMVVADFTDTPAANPILTPKSIRSLGDVPASIRFSPVYSFPRAGLHRLAVVLSQNYVTLFDLLDLGRTEISIPLCATGASCSYQVDDVVFDPSNLSMYVRVRGARDIFQIVLTESDTPNAIGTYDFRASISMLAVGASPGDVALFGVGKDARLAVVAPDTRSLVVIDPNTGRSVSVSIAIPATKIVLFTVPSQDPASPQPRNRAMLVDLQRGSTSVLVADLGVVENGGGLPPTEYAIRGAATSVVPLPAQGIAVLLFGKSSNGAVLSVVNLAETPSFFDFNSSSALGSPYLELRNAGLATRLWCVDSPEGGVPSPNSGIHFQDLVPAGNQPPSTIWLDQTITSINALASPGSDGRRYLVLEQVDPNAYGNLTFLDADNPDRATARTAYGFLFTDYLGRNQP